MLLVTRLSDLDPILSGISILGSRTAGSIHHTTSAWTVFSPRQPPGADHHDSWHSDKIEHRMVAMRINLSPAHSCGGVLQLRDSKSKEILCEMPNIGYGDALLFRIANHVQHAAGQSYLRYRYSVWLLPSPCSLSSTLMVFSAFQPRNSKSCETTRDPLCMAFSRSGWILSLEDGRR